MDIDFDEEVSLNLPVLAPPNSGGKGRVGRLDRVGFAHEEKVGDDAATRRKQSLSQRQRMDLPSSFGRILEEKLTRESATKQRRLRR